MIKIIINERSAKVEIDQDTKLSVTKTAQMMTHAYLTAVLSITPDDNPKTDQRGRIGAAMIGILDGVEEALLDNCPDYTSFLAEMRHRHIMADILAGREAR